MASNAPQLNRKPGKAAPDAPRGRPRASEPSPGSVGAARQILDAAARLLRQRGYEGTTARAIAEEVGLKAGSIYHHFPSKEVIVSTVVNEGVRVVLEAVVKALGKLPLDADPRLRIETAVRLHLLSSLRNSDYTSASIRTFAFLPDQVRENCRQERRRYEDVWRSLVNDAREAGLIAQGVSVDSVRLMLLGAVNWAGEWYRPGRMSIEKIAHDFATCIVQGRPKP